MSSRRQMAAPRWPAVLLALVVAGCAGAPKRAVLREYRPTAPRRQLGRAVWLASFASDELAGSLAPDGRRLLYAGDQRGNLDIWVKDLTSGQPRRLTRHVAMDTQPCFGPRGERVVFVSMRDDAKGDLFLLHDGELRRLTDAAAADAFPVFDPRGGAVYYARGDVGRTRIHRLSLASGGSTPASRWGATHPAVSADGQLLAFTWLDSQRRARVVLKRLADGRAWVVTTGDYHAGYPTFSPDGRWLAFVRFHRGAPRRARTATATASLWRVPLAAVLAGRPPARLMRDAWQLSGDGGHVLLPRWHRRGIVVTARRAGSLDLGLLPGRGIVPRRESAARQLRLALAQQRPWARLLCLRHVLRHRGAAAAPYRAEAFFRGARLFHRQGERAKARAFLRRLLAEEGRVAPTYAALARIELIALAGAAESSAPRERRAAAKGALARLEALQLSPRASARAAAHRLLRIGDLQRRAGQPAAAMRSYQRLVRRFAGQRRSAATAQLRRAELFERIGPVDLLTRYYLRLFDEYPRQAEVLQRAAARLIAIRERMAPARQIAQLRALVDAKPRWALLAVAAQRRIGELWLRRGRTDLAIRAIDAAVRSGGGSAAARRAAAEAGFALGALSLRHSKRLRRRGQVSEALEYYGQALAAYERIMRLYEHGTAQHERARREYLRLSLLQARQLIASGERALAEKRLRRVLDFDDDVIQAHRELIPLLLARGERAAIARRYRRRIERDPADFPARYALGYLATLSRPLRRGDLERAERQLKRAIALRPRSPFGHMTLGWVYEMRERYFGQLQRGWLEEAILRYQRASALNDAKVDPQTAADLLLNLANAFVALGSSWDEVGKLCRRRRKLGFGFRSRARRAFHLLSCGRADSATGRFAAATRQLERALALARKLGYGRLEAEVLARLALNEHLRGEYGASNRLFRRALPLFKRQGRWRAVAGLERTIAYNALLGGDQRTALARLRRARQALRKHGAPRVERFAPISTAPDPSTAPFGLDVAGERAALAAFREIVAERRGNWRGALKWQQRRLALTLARQRAHGDDPPRELGRELLLLRNRIALTALRGGDEGRFRRQLELALLAAKTSREADGSAGAAKLDPSLFAIEVGLALNQAEHQLARAGRGATASAAPPLRGIHRRLLALERQRGSWAAMEQKPLLAARLRLALWADLALLALRDPQTARSEQGDDPSLIARLGGVAGSGKGGKGGKAAALGAFRALLRGAAPYAAALAWLQRVVQETAPDADPAAEPEHAAARARGTTAALWRALGRGERLRWHVLATLDLAQVATLAVPRERLAAHPTTARLERLVGLCQRQRLTALRALLAAELAFRKRDRQAMAAAVAAFVARSPLLLGRSYAVHGAQLRRRVFGRAVTLALEQRDYVGALAWAEQRERRAFVDDLVAAGPAAAGVAAEPLRRLLRAAVAHRAELARRDPRASRAARQRWRARLRARREAFTRAEAALRRKAPAVAALLRVDAFSLPALARALPADAVAITALPTARRAVLLAVDGAGAVSARWLARPVAADARSRRRLARALAALAGKASRVYLDLGRLALPRRPLLPPSARQRVALATLWQLLDARAAHTALLGGVTLVGGDATRGSSAGARGWQRLAGARATVAAVERAAERRGSVLVAAPLRFAGGSAANVTVALPGADQPWRLARALGQRLPAELLLLEDVRFSGRRPQARRQRVALMRLLHGMGVATVVTSRGARRRGKASPLRAMLARVAAGVAPARAAAGCVVYGHGGASAARQRAAAARSLRAIVFRGARAFNRRPRDLPGTVRWLEHAVRLMDLLGGKSHKYLPGALLYLANAYTFQGDYRRALRRMERLLELRRAAVAAAAGGRPRLLAQAAYVKALQQLAWLLLRNESYERALKINQQAIALYRAVKRPLAARAAFDQRRVIAERKGDAKEALRAARQALSAAVKLARGKRPGPRVTAARAAIEVARLLRMRFARYDEARAVVGKAAGLLPPPAAEQLARLRAAARTLAGRANKGGAAKKKGGAAKKKNGAAKKKNGGVANKKLTARRRRLQRQLTAQRQLLTAHRDVLLEQARIAGARGDFGGAVRLARHALVLVTTAGAPRELPLLEVVNNLYYMGSYQRALATAERGLQRARSGSRRELQFLNVKGTALTRLGRVEPALRALRRALRLAKRLELGPEIAATHNNVGDALRAAGRFRAARGAFAAALQIDRRREDRPAIASDLVNLGLTDMALELEGAAGRQLRRALRIARDVGARLTEVKALLGLARLAQRRGAHGAVLRRCGAGAAIATRLGLRAWLWRFRLLAGRAQLRRGERRQAARSFRQGLRIVSELPPRPAPPPSLPVIEERPEDLYDELIDLLATSGKAREALGWVERLRARALAAAATAHLDAVGPPAARAALERYRALSFAVEAVRRAQLRGSAGKRGAVQLAARGQRLLAQRRDQARLVAAHNPRLLRLVAAQTAPPRLSRPQTPATVLVYHPTRRRLLIWVWRGGRLRLRRVSVSRARLRRAVRQLRSALTRFQPVERSAQQLHRWLLRPLGAKPGRRLVVVADGLLALVPFSALHDGKDFVVARHAIVRLPLLSWLLPAAAPPATRPERPTPTRRPAAKKGQDNPGWLSFSWRGTAKQPLPFTARESRALGRTFDSVRVFQAEDATRAAFLASAPAAQRIHLATHATFVADDPLRSAFRLHDGALALRDLLGKGLAAELVVLSTCNAARAPLRAAGTVTTVPQLFLVAGAQQVVASLWRVSDLGSALLIKHFFRQLRRQRDAGVALRAAQQQLRRRYPHPAFWGAFQLMRVGG